MTFGWKDVGGESGIEKLRSFLVNDETFRFYAHNDADLGCARRLR